MTYTGTIPKIKFRNTSSYTNCSAEDLGNSAYAPHPTQFYSGTINGKPLSFVSDAYDTYCKPDTFPINSSFPYSWEFNPVGNQPFSCTQTDTSMPKFIKYNLVPDSISKSNTTIISLGSINSQSVDIFYKDISIEPYVDLISLPANTNSINIKAPSIYYDPYITLFISYYSRTSVSLNGNRCIISKRTTYLKNLKVVP